MIDLENNFKDWLVNDFKMFLQDVPLADLKSYVKREALPGAKRMVSYYEDHLQKEQKRGIDTLGYNFITEKIHLYERYAVFLEGALQNPDMINLDDSHSEGNLSGDEPPLITDRQMFDKIVSNVENEYTIDGKKWHDKKQYALFMHLLETKFSCTNGRGKKGLHTFFENICKWDNIGGYSGMMKNIKTHWMAKYKTESQTKEQENDITRMLEVMNR